MIVTAGAACLLGQRDKEDGYIASKLRQAGAVFFVRSNLPQSMMNRSTTFTAGQKTPGTERAPRGAAAAGRGG
jgi:Asp-tRNA(Asn)/Glu-tRNA(Gln) amidotransferase A subunit family amidase